MTSNKSIWRALPWLCIGVTSIPITSWAATWSVGASAGFNQYFADEGSFHSSGGGVPFSGPSLEFQPGLRVERRSESGKSAVLIEGGFSFEGAKEAYATRSMVLTLHAVRSLGGDPTRGPYVMAGVGGNYFRFQDLSRFSSVEASGSGVLVGGGLGYAWGLANGHGRWRSELRYTRVGGISDGGLTIVPKGHSASLQLGFDLILN